MVERRGAILRHTHHTTEEQLAKEGITDSFKQLLAEAVFSGNSLISFQGATPYTSRFGRQPITLPDLAALPDDTYFPWTWKIYSSSKRSITTEIESTALDRVNRAMRSHTTTPGEKHDYKPGELVEFHRPSNNMDVSGWHGPATVVENQSARGQVVLKHDKEQVRARYGDVRRWMAFAALVVGFLTNAETEARNATSVVLKQVQSMPHGTTTTIGFLKPDNEWQSQSTPSQRKLYMALQHVAYHVLRYPDTFAIRIGRGISRITHVSEADSSVLIYWFTKCQNFQVFELDHGSELSTKAIVGKDWADAHYVHLLLSSANDNIMQEILNSPEDESISNQADASDRTDITDPDRLSTIDEGDEYNEEDLFFEVMKEEPEVIAQFAERYTDKRVTAQEGLHYHTAETCDERMNMPNEFDMDNDAYVEMLFPDHHHKLILDESPPPGACARLRVYPAGVKRAVVETDTDLLQPHA